MGSITELKRTRRLTRRIGNLVVEIDRRGVAIRRAGYRTRRKVTWAAIAAIGQDPDSDRPILENCDRRELLELLGGNLPD